MQSTYPRSQLHPRGVPIAIDGNRRTTWFDLSDTQGSSRVALGWFPDIEDITQLEPSGTLGFIDNTTFHTRGP